MTSTTFDGSDAVTALSPDLKRTGIFAPSSWYHDSQNDLDLGSTQPALLPDGMLLADGKSGTAYLVSAARLGGVGGQLAQAQVCPAFGAAAVQGSIVYEPCEQGGMAAIDTAGNQIHVRWRGPSSAWGSPVVGGGRGLGHRLERGYAVRARPGHRRDQGLAEPGNDAAALLVHVDDRQPRVPRHAWRAWSRSAASEPGGAGGRRGGRIPGPLGMKGRLGPWPQQCPTSNHRPLPSSSTWTGR